MFGMGMPEIILIMAIALIVIGPKKLPDLAKSLGRALGEFKHATKEFKSAIDIDTDMKDIGKPFENLSETVKKSFEDKKEPEETETGADTKSGADKTDAPAAETVVETAAAPDTDASPESNTVETNTDAKVSEAGKGA